MRLMMLRAALLLLLVLLPASATAQPADTLFALTEHLLHDEEHRQQLPYFWKYHLADSAVFAQPDYDASDWPTTDIRMLADSTLPPQWDGLGWFRLLFRIDPQLVGQTLGIQIDQQGASAVYLDGNLLRRAGRPATSLIDEEVATNPMPIAVTFYDSTTHLIAVRYSNLSTKALHDVGYEAGFQLYVGELETMLAARAATIRSATTWQWGLTGIFLAFGLLHLFLFAYYPKSRENLYFSVVAFCIAAVVFNNYQERYFYDSAATLIFMRRLWSPLSLLTVLAFLRFIYAIYYDRAPRHFYILAGIGALIGIWGWFDPTIGWFAPAGGRSYAYAFALIVHAETLRTTFMATILERRGPYVIAIGAVAFVVAFSYPVLVVIGLLPVIVNPLVFAFLVILVLLLSISLFLSSRFAHTSRSLEKKLAEVKSLTEEKVDNERRRERMRVEYERKLQELEDARRLQLSMLPEKVPDHPELEIAVHMETAEEVGGDYYDFAVDEDGALTLAIGDATGHGLRASTMVTAMKSLFNALGREKDVLDVLRRSTKALKEMNLQKLYMALALVKFTNGAMRLAAAGMPPALLYRAATGEIETIDLKGMPLGSFPDFPYDERQVPFAPGDTILFMSDGFPERFNAAGEMMGYDAPKAVFEKVGGHSPQDIIDNFLEAGRAWSNGAPPDDDVTFVAVRRR